MKALLDTHILLWWHGDRSQLSPQQQNVIGAANADSPMRISDITLWEVAMLQHMGRIGLGVPLREWLEKAVAPPLARRHGISPAVAAELAALPDSFHRDPADRILVATARVLGATLLTRDRRIIDAKLVDTLS